MDQHVEIVLHQWVKGDYEQTRVLCQRLADQNPNSLSYAMLLGILALLMGDEEQANAIWLSLFDAASSISIYDQLTAIAHLSLNHRAFAIAEIADRVSLDLDLPMDEMALRYLHLGRAIAQQGQYDQALDCWQHATQIDPHLYDAYRYQGEMRQHLGEWQAALEVYETAYTLGVIDAEGCDRLALCHSQLQHWQQAEQTWHQALGYDPDRTSIYANLAFVYLNVERFEDAVSALHRWVHDHQSFVDCYCAWAIAQPSNSVAAAYPVLQSLTQGKSPGQAIRIAWGQWLDRVGYRRLAMDLRQGAIASPQATSSTTPISTPSPKTWLESTSHLERLIYPSTQVHLVPPKSLDPDIHYSFRFGDTMPLPGSFVTTVDNGRCWFDTSQSAMAILTSDHHLIPNLSPQFPILSPGHPVDISQHQIFKHPDLAPVRSLSGTVVVLAGLLNNVYFHWMLDVLPRLELLEQAQIDWSAVDHIVLPRSLSFQRETIDRLGIPQEKCIDPVEISHLQADRLIVPSFPGAIAWFPRWACDFLRQHFLSEASQGEIPSRRLYITRGSTAPRTVLNEGEVVTYLQRRNFEVVSLEALSVQAQATLLAQASVVISPHGSGLTNLVFCQPGTPVIELFSPDFVYSCYWFLSTVMKLDYAYLLGEKPEGFWLYQQLYTSSRLACMTVDVPKLDYLLNQMGL
ncbi:MAG: DUF563 domain-containing protein [Synechococcales cyanobacterium T60_A2020_003]|nr:DUF563 domain-containing protein [Synechococcales cyanobacterium T60_A2020_003]